MIVLNDEQGSLGNVEVEEGEQGHLIGILLEEGGDVFVGTETSSKIVVV